MAWKAKAWTATILALVILSLALAPTWSMAFLILFGMIGVAIDAAGKNRRRNPAPAVDAPASVDDAGKMRRNPESSSTSLTGIEYEVFLSFRGQAGDFERYFNQHEIDKFDSNTIETWKEVLRQIGGLSGYDRENINGGHESQLVQEVVERVMQPRFNHQSSPPLATIAVTPFSRHEPP
ncbi:hypothetical protein NL676_009349 [Syzygium grande]|nr:hypothetical protein NL676_009349 [Syzygium grande]